MLGSSWGESGVAKLAELRACLVAAQQQFVEPSRAGLRHDEAEEAATLND